MDLALHSRTGGGPGIAQQDGRWTWHCTAGREVDLALHSRTGGGPGIAQQVDLALHSRTVGQQVDLVLHSRTGGGPGIAQQDRRWTWHCTAGREVDLALHSRTGGGPGIAQQDVDLAFYSRTWTWHSTAGPEVDLAIHSRRRTYVSMPGPPLAILGTVDILRDSLHGVWRYGVGTRTCWPGGQYAVTDEMVSLSCNFYLSVKVREIIPADLSLEIHSHVAGIVVVG